MAEEQLINYTALPTLEDFHSSDAEARMIMGPIGSGKSVGCCIEVYARAIRQKPCLDGIRRSRWAIIRNTYGELKTTTIKTWQEWFPDRICPIVYDSPIRGMMKMILPDKTSMELEILFLALDKPKDAKRLLSLELTGIWFNEVREIPKSLVDAGLSRTGRYPSAMNCPNDKSWTGLIGDTNPPPLGSWYETLAEKTQPDNWEFFRQPGGLLPILDVQGRTVGYEANPAAENVHNHKQGHRYWMKNIGSADPAWIKDLSTYTTSYSSRPAFFAADFIASFTPPS